MKHIQIFFSLFLLSFVAGISSCDFLDVQDYYDDTLTYDSVFHNERNLQRYLFSIAGALPDESKLLSYPYIPGPLATDEGIVAFGTGEFRGIAFTIDEIRANRMEDMGTWGLYHSIRRINIMLNRIDEAVDLTPASKNYILGYAYFIRAYCYYHILMNHGPVILVGDDPLPNNEMPEVYDTYRATYDESVEYICQELERAAELMPSTVLLSEFGRPTKGAAYGLVARLRLQHASPLFNGGEAARRYYGSWTRSVDGVHYISQTYDESRWALAAAAAKRVIDMEMYELHTVDADKDTPELPVNIPSATFPEGAGGIDPFRSYSEMFTGEAIAQHNKEYVWGRMSGPVKDITKHSFANSLLGGWNGMALTQKVVDAYRMVDGRNIDDSSEEYPFLNEGMYSGGTREFSGYIMNNNIHNSYVNREMRFYACVGYNRRFWSCNSTVEDRYKNQTITYHLGGNADRYDNGSESPDYTLTGYVLTKHVHPDDAWKGNNSRVLDKAYGIIRYAEILMAYAEALNNLTSTHTVTIRGPYREDITYTVSRDLQEIRRAFNQIRFRAGLPGLEETERDDIQKAIEQESLVEFLFENRRFYDVRRWGIYEDVDSEPIVGMNILSAEPGFYEKTIVNHKYTRERIVDKKLVWLPIPQDEVRKVKSLDQNPGWGE